MKGGTVMPTPSLPTLTIARSAPRNVDVLVVGLSSEGSVGVPKDVEQAYTKRFGSAVGDLTLSIGAKPEVGSRRTLPAVGNGPRLVVVGIGNGEPSMDELRQAAGNGIRAAGELSEEAPLSVAVSLGRGEGTVRAVAEGALLGSYRYATLSANTNGSPPGPGIGIITVVEPGAPQKGIAGDALTVARAVVTAREWVNLPPNLLYPASFADEVRGFLKTAPVAIEVLDEKALLRDGYGGILAVGGGSSRLPRLVRLSYRPRGAKTHLALVGKGITFDSGGLNIKTADGMYTMKCDMSGAAAVFAATRAIADLGLKINVTAYGSLAENLPSDTSYRPSDVLTIYGGKTVENGNTDAEGRLVLADALARAGEDRPDLVVDVATLTGACVVALGSRTAGLMTSDGETADRLLAAAEAGGEEVWQLPIPAETRGKLDSKVADLRSTGTDRAGGALLAAAFLREFVADGTPWAHLDIAGPAFHDGAPYGYVSSGGTGAGVRTLIALARSLAA
jgi:leucyl aminopeptidase